MAKNFERAGSSKKFTEIARASAEKANVVTVRMIGDESLFNYPGNEEDIGNTADLENSIRELGFTDPLEVTSFGMEDGKYMIVSGHRRRAAGVKTGMDLFPCIIKSFGSEGDLRNYVLLSNSQRDSSKDPLLFCRRYKMHERYLKDSGFKGSVREEIAKRLGISTQQADRYNQFNKIISPVWDMVRDELVGMSSVLPMASHSVEEQEEILSALYGRIDAGVSLTRDVCDRVIKGYRAGKADNTEAAEEEPEPVEAGEEETLPRKGGRAKSAERLTRHLDGVVKCLGGKFESADEAESAMKSMKAAVEAVVSEMHAIGESYGRQELFRELLKDMDKSVRRYKKEKSSR